MTFFSDPWLKDYHISQEPHEIMRHAETGKVLFFHVSLSHAVLEIYNSISTMCLRIWQYPTFLTIKSGITTVKYWRDFHRIHPIEQCALLELGFPFVKVPTSSHWKAHIQALQPLLFVQVFQHSCQDLASASTQLSDLLFWQLYQYWHPPWRLWAALLDVDEGAKVSLGSDFLHPRGPATVLVSGSLPENPSII